MYDQRYDIPAIRSGVYSVVERILPLYKPNDILYGIDLGSGTCRKTIPLAAYLLNVDAVERSELMIEKARHNIATTATANIRLIEADVNNTQLPGATYDIASSFLAPFSIPEVHRLLRPGGLFVAEILGIDDKYDLKMAFGEDQFGWRGYNLNQTEGVRLQMLQLGLQPFFDAISFTHIRFRTSISRTAAETLLTITPTVRGFKVASDAHRLNDLTGNDGMISFEEHRIIVCAKSKSLC